MKINNKHLIALLEATLVTFLWSTSYVLIQIGLDEINPLAFAAYRYFFASLILLVPLFSQINKGGLENINHRKLLLFLVLGFTGYFIAQGFQFLGLFFLNSVTVTFILNLTPLFVLGFSVLLLNEWPTSIQAMGIGLTLIGVVIFFYDSLQQVGMITGVLVTLISGIGWALYMIILRRHLIKNNENIITITSISMFFGAIMLLVATGLTNNIVNVSFNGWMIIFWLSGINTAVAFFLWNHALKTLKVIEQSILQNSMLIQISLLAYFFLQESINEQKIIGMTIVFIGVLIVQIKTNKSTKFAAKS